MASEEHRLPMASLGAFLRLLWRVARQVFHETTGALFLVLAIVGGVSAWQEWRRGGVPWPTALAIGFTLMMLALAVSAFRSARRIR